MENCYVWEYGERERPGTNHTTIKEKIKQCINGRTFSKVIGWGMGQAMKKKIFIRKKKIVEEIKGMLKKERKKERKKNMQVENSPPPP